MTHAAHTKEGEEEKKRRREEEKTGQVSKHHLIIPPLFFKDTHTHTHTHSHTHTHGRSPLLPAPSGGSLHRDTHTLSPSPAQSFSLSPPFFIAVPFAILISSLCLRHFRLSFSLPPLSPTPLAAPHRALAPSLARPPPPPLSHSLLVRAARPAPTPPLSHPRAHSGRPSRSPRLITPAPQRISSSNAQHSCHQPPSQFSPGPNLSPPLAAPQRPPPPPRRSFLASLFCCCSKGDSRPPPSADQWNSVSHWLRLPAFRSAARVALCAPVWSLWLPRTALTLTPPPHSTPSSTPATTCCRESRRKTTGKSAWCSISTRRWCTAPSRWGSPCPYPPPRPRWTPCSPTSFWPPFSLQPVPNADFVVPIEIDGTVHNVFVLKRPFVDEFLAAVGPLFEIVLFTASLSKVR